MGRVSKLGRLRGLLVLPSFGHLCRGTSLGGQGGSLVGYVEHELAEPAVGWVFGEAGVPDHGDGVLGEVEGRWAGDQRRRGGTLTEAGRCGENEVALSDDFEGGGEVGDAQGDAPLQALCVEDAVDDSGALASWRDEDVIEAGVCLEAESAGRERGVVTSEEAFEGVSKEGAALELGVDLGAEVERVWVEEHWVDREVDVAGFETVGEALWHGDDGKIDRWCLLA